MSKIKFMHFDPDDQCAIEEIISEWEPLIPGWCEQLIIKNVRAADKESCAPASIDIKYEYRFATLNIYSEFWHGNNECFRREFLLHEICHLISEPMCMMVEKIKSLVSEDIHAMIDEDHRIAFESMTQDMTNSVIRLMDSDE